MQNIQKTFNTLSNAPLTNLRKKEKWINYALCLKQGLSVRKAAEQCEIHKNTGFRWRHIFLTNANDIKANELFGIVEMNSMLMIKSYEGSKSMPRKARKGGLNIEQKN